jgi:hypothetical protein
VFVAAAVLLLGVIHPTSTPVASSSTATSTSTSTSTSTTAPRHPTTTTTTVLPSKVSVVVANASGVAGAAAAVTKELTAGGWNLLAPTNATTDVKSSSVYYVAGFQPAATTIAASLHLAPSTVVPYTTAAPISTIGAADVLVVVGPDLATESTSTTTTTTKGTTTTTAAKSVTTTTR